MLRKSLLELSEYCPDTTEMTTPEKKLTFFQVLKNTLQCAFCKEKDCPAKYQPDREVMVARWSGSYHPVGCSKEEQTLGKMK